MTIDHYDRRTSSISPLNSIFQFLLFELWLKVKPNKIQIKHTWLALRVEFLLLLSNSCCSPAITLSLFCTDSSSWVCDFISSDSLVFNCPFSSSDLSNWDKEISEEAECDYAKGLKLLLASVHSDFWSDGLRRNPMVLFGEWSWTDVRRSSSDINLFGNRYTRPAKGHQEQRCLFRGDWPAVIWVWFGYCLLKFDQYWSNLGLQDWFFFLQRCDIQLQLL